MDRRRFLRGAAALGAGLVAGCIEIRNPGLDRPDEGTTYTPPDDPDFDEETRERAREVGETARRSVVVAEADRPGPAAATGAAWFVDADTLATTAHGVADADSVTAWTIDGASIDATVLGRSDGGLQGDDVAALAVDEAGPPLEAGDSDALEEGQPLVHVGHPFAVGNWVVAIGRFAGTHSATGRLLSTLPAMQGNSGSPVLTLDGEVVAMTTGSVPREQAPRRRGEAPEPASSHVREEYADATFALHHAVGTVEEYVQQWR